MYYNLEFFCYLSPYHTDRAKYDTPHGLDWVTSGTPATLHGAAVSTTTDDVRVSARYYFQRHPDYDNVSVDSAHDPFTVFDVVIDTPVSTAYVAVGDNLQLGCDPVPAAATGGTYTWTKASGPGTVFFSNPSAQNPTFSAGVPGEYKVRVQYALGGTNATDISQSIWVFWIMKIPLGSSANLSQAVIGKVYVPTQAGGELTLSGGNIELFYTDGSDLDDETAATILNGGLVANRVAQGSPCGYSVPAGTFGWFYAKVTTSASISATFVESGAAEETPWNGWYWPMLDSINPNLYDTSGSYTPLKNYDLVYNTSTAAEEYANHSGGESWYGHCWGWSLASIAVAQPSATTKNGVAFNQDEMEGLYTELGDGAKNGTLQSWEWVAGNAESHIPPGPPSAATDEGVDAWPGIVHSALSLRMGPNHKKALVANLRSNESEGESSEVWNHPVYAFESAMVEAPGGNERLVQATTIITSGTDGPAMPSDSAKREDTYVYIIEYDTSGEVVTNSQHQNWISSSHFAPANFCIVKPTTFDWSAASCSITLTNVNALYNP